ncbi:MAG TPA: energy transducer TonB [Thermoanaerobaculia bacterium]
MRPLAAALLAALVCAGAAPLRAEDRGAEQTRNQKPVYPDDLLKQQKQGNVLLTAHIDPQGKLTDIRVLAATDQGFVRPAAEAVRAWEFRPATRDGKPVEIFANVAVRFRVEGERRGLIPAPILGDLAIHPADEAGKATAPEGFPVRRGKDKALRAEALLDLPPNVNARTLSLKIEAVSPSGKHVAVFQPPVAVPAGAKEVKVPVVARIGPDWEEGVWLLRFTVDGGFAGSGQWWLANDPEHFHFVMPTPKPAR